MRITGNVKFFNHLRGFGFVTSEGYDYFVHISDVNGDMLLGGEAVSFKSVEGHKGLQAIEVERLDPPPMEEEEGVIKFFNPDKGYGFIGREGKADVFAHFTDFDNIAGTEDIQQGQNVSFVVRQGRDGRDRAYQITILDLLD